MQQAGPDTIIVFFYPLTPTTYIRKPTPHDFTAVGGLFPTKLGPSSDPSLQHPTVLTSKEKTNQTKAMATKMCQAET